MPARIRDGVEVDVERTGNTTEHKIYKDGDKPINSRSERESRERDGWSFTKQRLKDHEGMSDREAGDACRKAREREHARKRDRGEDY